MDQIVYLTLYSGVDGLDKTTISGAYFDKTERDKNVNGWYRPDQKIIDVDEERQKALNILGAVGRLVLGLTK